MPSFSDSIFIFFLALLLFGPKKLPELARYVGKLLGEFRRASAEFRLQMDDEFRAMEQADQQKKIAAMEAAAPVAALNIPEPEHPHMPAPIAEQSLDAVPAGIVDAAPPAAEPEKTTLPIASSGDLHLMPPSTGLPTGRSSSLGAVFETIPHVAETVPQEAEATHNA